MDAMGTNITANAKQVKESQTCHFPKENAVFGSEETTDGFDSHTRYHSGKAVSP
jgi:hypothetical protein